MWPFSTSTSGSPGSPIAASISSLTSLTSSAVLAIDDPPSTCSSDHALHISFAVPAIVDPFRACLANLQLRRCNDLVSERFKQPHEIGVGFPPAHGTLH